MTDTGKEEQADEERAIRNASSGQTIQLSQDITCKKNGGDRIKVEGKTITLDLNGHTLYRNRTKKDEEGRRRPCDRGEVEVRADDHRQQEGRPDHPTKKWKKNRAKLAARSAARASRRSSRRRSWRWLRPASR